jgi:adenosylhomocysteinase
VSDASFCAEKEIRMDFDIKDIELAEKGKLRMDWAAQNMPVLQLIRRRFQQELPLKGIRISVCLHVTTETANLVRTLKEGGADIVLCAPNSLSTQDDVAASLVKDFGIPVFATKGEDGESRRRHLHRIIAHSPQLTIDDGADLACTLHAERKEFLNNILGGAEETTTGVNRLQNLSRQNLLRYPIIAVNEARTKHIFDNCYGTGQSVMDGILRATNILIAGKVFVVCGYGWCGRGIAKRAAGLGARVIVVEVEPIKAIEALMEGYQVMPLAEVVGLGDIFVTATGGINIVRQQHFKTMKDGAICCNAGHFNFELGLSGLEPITASKRIVREFVEEYTLNHGRRIYIIGGGNLVNLASAEGHPANVMDLSFSNHALSAEFIVKQGKSLEKKVYPVPTEIDRKVARLKLEAMNVRIDEMTEEQRNYLDVWEVDHSS